MRKPDKNLDDDYSVKPTPEVISKPPRTTELRRTGEIDVLKPLTRSEVHAKPARIGFKAFRPPGSHQPLWFRRFLAMGSGALVMIALVLVSAILVGINDPAAGPDVAKDGKAEEKLTETEVRLSFDIFSPSSFEQATDRVGIVRRSAKRRATRALAEPTRARPLRYARPLQPIEPNFAPTTLVIYSENGVIKTSIEPWLRSS